MPYTLCISTIFMRKKYIVFALQICVMGYCQKGSGQASCQPWEANRNCFQWLLDKVIESEVQGDGRQSELVAWGPMSTSSHPEAWALRKNIDVFGIELILPKRKRGESFNSEESWILPHKGKLWTKWKGSWSRSYNDSSQQGVPPQLRRYTEDDGQRRRTQPWGQKGEHLSIA